MDSGKVSEPFELDVPGFFAEVHGEDVTNRRPDAFHSSPHARGACASGEFGESASDTAGVKRWTARLKRHAPQQAGAAPKYLWPRRIGRRRMIED